MRKNINQKTKEIKVNVHDEKGTRAYRIDHLGPSLCISGKLEVTGAQLLNRQFILASEVKMRKTM